MDLVLWMEEEAYEETQVVDNVLGEGRDALCDGGGRSFLLFVDE